MTYREDPALPAELLERVSKQGFDILPELIQVIIHAAMQAERQNIFDFSRFRVVRSFFSEDALDRIYRKNLAQPSFSIDQPILYLAD